AAAGRQKYLSELPAESSGRDSKWPSSRDRGSQDRSPARTGLAAQAAVPSQPQANLRFAAGAPSATRFPATPAARPLSRPPANPRPAPAGVVLCSPETEAFRQVAPAETRPGREPRRQRIRRRSGER